MWSCSGSSVDILFSLFVMFGEDSRFFGLRPLNFLYMFFSSGIANTISVAVLIIISHSIFLPPIILLMSFSDSVLSIFFIQVSLSPS